MTRSHGVRCVKWSTIPPPVIICIPSCVARARYLTYRRGRTGVARRDAARCIEHERGASMARYISATQTASSCPSRTRAENERIDGDPRMRRVREHRLPIDCIIIIIVPPSLPRSRYVRCPVRTTDPSFRFRERIPPMYGHRPRPIAIAIDLYDPAGARVCRRNF